MKMTYKKFFKKAVAALGILAFLASFFGCDKAPKSAEHELSEISAVSISCGHTDYSYSYSFQLRRQEGVWLFDAECFSHGNEYETVIENREADGEDAEEMLEILENNSLIAYAENYKKQEKSPFEISDETTYVFCLTFSDGSRYLTSDRQEELEKFFYRLAEKTD